MESRAKTRSRDADSPSVGTRAGEDQRADALRGFGKDREAKDEVVQRERVARAARERAAREDDAARAAAPPEPRLDAREEPEDELPTPTNAAGAAGAAIVAGDCDATKRQSDLGPAGPASTDGAEDGDV